MARNCPFYGAHMLTPEPGSEILRLVISGSSNQCALMEARSPCSQEALRRMIDWRTCPRVLRIRTATEPVRTKPLREPGED
jgi:hypothetical protein